MNLERRDKMNWLKGKKTYICMAVVACAFFAKGMGWIDEAMFEMIAGIFSVGGVAALRAGVTKSGPEQ